MAKNISEQEFNSEVLQASKQVPVLVDFWAEWCGPCRVLGPILDKIGDEYRDKLKVVKVNTEQNQQLALQYRIQSIPAVKLFMDGRVVGEFVGALPEASVKAFLAEHLPNPHLDAARAKIQTGDAPGALHEIRAAGPSLKADEVIWQWLVAFANHKEITDATLISVVQLISPYGSPFSDRRNAILEQLQQGGDGAAAARAMLAGGHDHQIQTLLSLLEKATSSDEKNSLREQLVRIFTALGQQDPKIAEYRKRMARLLY